MTNEGWIWLYRKFLGWEWYDYPTVKIIFLHCLLSANHKNMKWRDIVIKRGQFVTSYEKLAATNGITVQQVRTALEKLQSTNEITYQSTSKYSIITVKNYNLYQDNNKAKTRASNNQIGGQNNKQITTNNKRDILISKDINISLSSIEKNSKNKISDDEREILKKYLKKNNPNIKNIRAYLKKVIENGDYKDILNEEKAKLKKEDKSNIDEDIKQVKDELSAIRFIAKYGDQLSDVQLPQVEKIMKEYNFNNFDEVVKASFNYKK